MRIVGVIGSLLLANLKLSYYGKNQSKSYIV